MVDVAEVRIWGELAGAVRWEADRQLASFQYDKKFLGKEIELSPIKMPVQNGSRIYRFPELRRARNESASTFKGLPGLLADALPDRYGNQLINRWLSWQGRAADSMNPVEQLCFIGTRGMGALEFQPAQFKTAEKADFLEIAGLVSAAREILSNRQNFEMNIRKDERSALSEILKIGTSAGGARPKAVIALNRLTGEVRSGQTTVPHGFSHWLIKLDGVSDSQFGQSNGFGRVEFAYYLMAKDSGINMMECDLLEENGRAHFMTRRFDREGEDTKHHIQTFCGIQHFDYNNIFAYSYEQLFQTMRILKMSYTEAEQMFRRMVFNVMATNYDDHTKNFSFILKKKNKWGLSPAYDVCYAYDPENKWVSQQTLSINGKHQGITKADLMTIADENRIKNGAKIVDEIHRIVLCWSQYAARAKVNSVLTKTIIENLTALSFSRD